MKVGDIVVLKGLDWSMKMVVEWINEGRAVCVFHDKEGRPHKESYDLQILEKVK